jgi:hypothetical protein
MGSSKTGIEGRQIVQTIQDGIAEYPLVLDVPIMPMAGTARPLTRSQVARKIRDTPEEGRMSRRRVGLEQLRTHCAP